MKQTQAYLIFSWSFLAQFLILSLNFPGATSGLPPWLNICGSDGKHYYAYDVPSCPQGYYFKTPISGFCACGHGIWQFKTDYCAKDIIIAAHAGDCYSINSPIRLVRHLGDKFDAYKERYFITDPTWDEIRSFKGSMSVGGYSFVGAISPRHSLLSCTETTCIKVAKTSDTVYKPSDPFPPFLFSHINESDGFSVINNCPYYDYTIEQPYPGAIVKHGMLSRIGKVQQFNETIRSSSCKASCKAIPPVTIYTDTDEYATDPLIAPNCSETDNNYKDLPGIVMNETHEQSIRMMINHYDVILKGKKTPSSNTTAYEYFQTSRQIFEKVCPATEVPPLLIRSLLRMFRLAINESWAKYPYEQTGDGSEDARLKIGLTACLAGANQGIEFVYNETVCPKEFINTRMSWPGSVRNFSTGLPCNLQYNTSKYDYPTEAAWKMVMFVHYYCAVQFEQQGFDHSRLEYKLRNLFNREIRHRWYKPGESARLMEHVFQEYDLTKFKMGVDRCVAAARDSSPYRKWIWRPKYIQFCEPANTINGVGLPAKRSKTALTKLNKDVWDGAAYCINSFTEPMVSGWTKTGSRCLAKPILPNCDRNISPPRLVFPPPTFVNALGNEITDPKIEKCYSIVGDFLFEPGAEKLCEKYNYGENIEIGKPLTQFDGKHCWSPFYHFAFLCENMPGLAATLTNLLNPSPMPIHVDVTSIPEGTCNKTSPGQKLTDEDLKQCWRILGDRIFLPGNELICYEIDFGDGLEPALPPPLPLPFVTYNDPRGAALEDPKQQRCYKRIGDWMFVNESLCCLTDNGKNIIHDPLTQFDGKHCYSCFYSFAYRCENKDILINTGFPNLTDTSCKPTYQIQPPIHSNISMGLNLTDPDLKQCWTILGDIIYEKENELVCYLIDFGTNQTAMTTENPNSVTSVPVTFPPIDTTELCKDQVKFNPPIHYCKQVNGNTGVVCCDYTNQFGYYFPVQKTLACDRPNVFTRFPKPICKGSNGAVVYEGFPKDDPSSCKPNQLYHRFKLICITIPSVDFVLPESAKQSRAKAVDEVDYSDGDGESRSGRVPFNGNSMMSQDAGTAPAPPKNDGGDDAGSEKEKHICMNQVKYNPEFIECYLVNGDTQQFCCDYWEDGRYHPREKSLPCDPPNVFKDQPEPQCLDPSGNIVHKGMPSDSPETSMALEVDGLR